MAGSYKDGYMKPEPTSKMLSSETSCVCGHSRGEHAYRPGKSEAGKCCMPGCKCTQMVATVKFICKSCERNCKVSMKFTEEPPTTCLYLMVVPNWEVIE